MIEGYPIFDRIPDFANDPVSDSDSIVSKGTTGLRDYINWDARPLIKLSQNHTFDSVEPVDEVLQQFVTNMGASGSFWVPTWHPDFEMVTGLPNQSNQLVIYPVDYEASYLTDTTVFEPGHYLAIYNETTGTLWTPKVLSVAVNGTSGYETLTLSENAPEDFFTSSTIISLLVLSRHIDDTLEINWSSPYIADANLDMIQSRTFTAASIVPAYGDPALIILNRQLQTNDDINSMASEGSRAFIVGEFTSADVIEREGITYVNNIPEIVWNTTETNARNRCASFDMDTGVWDSWNPSLHAGDPKSLIVDDKAYILTNASPYLKAYDKNTGALDSGFNPDVRDVDVPKLYKTGGKVILSGNWYGYPSGRATVYNNGVEIARPFQILDSSGEPLLEVENDLPADSDVWVLCVNDGYIYFASSASYSYTNRDYVLVESGTGGVELTGTIELDPVTNRIIFSDPLETVQFANSKFIKIFNSSNIFNNVPVQVSFVNTAVGYIQVKANSLASDDHSSVSPNLSLNSLQLQDSTGGTEGVSLRIFPELLIDIKPKGIYRMSVDGKFDSFFKSDITKSDYNWGTYSPAAAFADAENNKLVVYGKYSDRMSSWVLDLQTGDIPGNFPDTLGLVTAGGGFALPEVRNIEPLGNYLILSGVFGTFGGVLKCEKSTGSLKTPYGIGFPEKAISAVALVNPKGDSIWVGENLFSSAHTNLYKTMPTDGRYLDVPDLS
jgi:hypothetical protein